MRANLLLLLVPLGEVVASPHFQAATGQRRDVAPVHKRVVHTRDIAVTVPEIKADLSKAAESELSGFEEYAKKIKECNDFKCRAKETKCALHKAFQSLKAWWTGHDHKHHDDSHPPPPPPPPHHPDAPHPPHHPPHRPEVPHKPDAPRPPQPPHEPHGRPSHCHHSKAQDSDSYFSAMSQQLKMIFLGEDGCHHPPPPPSQGEQEAGPHHAFRHSQDFRLRLAIVHIAVAMLALILACCFVRWVRKGGFRSMQRRRHLRREARRQRRCARAMRNNEDEENPRDRRRHRGWRGRRLARRQREAQVHTPDSSPARDEKGFVIEPVQEIAAESSRQAETRSVHGTPIEPPSYEVHIFRHVRPGESASDSGYGSNNAQIESDLSSTDLDIDLESAPPAYDDENDAISVSGVVVDGWNYSPTASFTDGSVVYTPSPSYQQHSS